MKMKNQVGVQMNVHMIYSEAFGTEFGEFGKLN